jgi:hypothetical protein
MRQRLCVWNSCPLRSGMIGLRLCRMSGKPLDAWTVFEVKCLSAIDAIADVYVCDDPIDHVTCASPFHHSTESSSNVHGLRLLSQPSLSHGLAHQRADSRRIATPSYAHQADLSPKFGLVLQQS